MLLFFDESFERIGTQELLHVYAGFGIEAGKYRHLVAATHQLKLKYLRCHSGMTDTDRATAWASHFLVSGTPEDTELKAKELLSMTTLTRLREDGFAAGFSLCSDVLEAARQIGATTFGTISYPRSIESIQHDSAVLPVHMRRIMERVNLWVEEVQPGRHAAFVLDTLNNRTNPVLSKHFTEFLMKSSEGKRMRSIVPSPFWVDSKTTVGCQVADLIAHVLMNSAREMPSRKEGMRPLWEQVVKMEFRSYNGATHGIRKLKRQA